MFQMLTLCQSDWRRANAHNVSFETLYGDQFMLLTQWIILNYPVILSLWSCTTVFLETYPLYSCALYMRGELVGFWKSLKMERTSYHSFYNTISPTFMMIKFLGQSANLFMVRAFFIFCVREITTKTLYFKLLTLSHFKGTWFEPEIIWNLQCFLNIMQI